MGKGDGTPAMAENVVNSRFEYVFIFSAKDNPSRAIVGGSLITTLITSIAHHARQRMNIRASMPRPSQRIFQNILSLTLAQADRVFEPFAGTGTTLIACEKTKRKCYGMEIDPHYCDVIVARWEKYTGKKAPLIAKVSE